MIAGVLIGNYQPEGVRKAFGGHANLQGTSIRKSESDHRVAGSTNSLLAILIGLLVMMWPVLTKVQYERLPIIFKRRSIWLHIGISLVLNWVIAPLIMLALAWATLPESSLEQERKGVILVGIARCIGMSFR